MLKDEKEMVYEKSRWMPHSWWCTATVRLIPIGSKHGMISSLTT